MKARKLTKLDDVTSKLTKLVRTLDNMDCAQNLFYTFCGSNEVGGKDEFVAIASNVVDATTGGPNLDQDTTRPVDIDEVVDDVEMELVSQEHQDEASKPKEKKRKRSKFKDKHRKKRDGRKKKKKKHHATSSTVKA
ncbi:hypothetical protein V6N13_072507 [Hibiscus sabdariffa]